MIVTAILVGLAALVVWLRIRDFTRMRACEKRTLDMFMDWLHALGSGLLPNDEEVFQARDRIGAHRLNSITSILDFRLVARRSDRVLLVEKFEHYRLRGGKIAPRTRDYLLKF